MASDKQKQSPYGSVKFTSIDDYHRQQSIEIIPILNELRNIIRVVSSNSIETISYNMPAFKEKEVLVYYAAYKNHIGFYPTNKPIEVFSNELSDYKTSKGAIQFPINKSLPKELIQKIVLFRLNEVSKKHNKIN